MVEQEILNRMSAGTTTYYSEITPNPTTTTILPMAVTHDPEVAYISQNSSYSQKKGVGSVVFYDPYMHDMPFAEFEALKEQAEDTLKNYDDLSDDAKEHLLFSNREELDEFLRIYSSTGKAIAEALGKDLESYFGTPVKYFPLHDDEQFYKDWNSIDISKGYIDSVIIVAHGTPTSIKLTMKYNLMTEDELKSGGHDAGSAMFHKYTLTIGKIDNLKYKEIDILYMSSCSTGSNSVELNLIEQFMFKSNTTLAIGSSDLQYSNLGTKDLPKVEALDPGFVFYRYIDKKAYSKWSGTSCPSSNKITREREGASETIHQFSSCTDLYDATIQIAMSKVPNMTRNRFYHMHGDSPWELINNYYSQYWYNYNNDKA